MRTGHSRLFHRCGFVLLPLLFCALAGCGGGKGSVSGTVTVNDKPLPMGMIVFTPATGAAVAAEIKDGKYEAVGVPAGDVKVSLDLRNLKLIADQSKGAGGMAAQFGKSADPVKEQSLKPSASNPKMPAEAKAQLAEQMKSMAEANRLQKEALALLPQIPEKYTNPDQSGWTLKVSGGSNTFDAKVTK
jgi:hypothetical protein